MLCMKVKHNIIRYVILVAGLVLCVLGILRDEPAFIMQKAAIVCLECIGIG